MKIVIDTPEIWNMVYEALGQYRDNLEQHLDTLDDPDHICHIQDREKLAEAEKMLESMELALLTECAFCGAQGSEEHLNTKCQ